MFMGLIRHNRETLEFCMINKYNPLMIYSTRQPFFLTYLQMCNLSTLLQGKENVPDDDNGIGDHN